MARQGAFFIDDREAIPSPTSVMLETGKVWWRVGFTDEALRRWLLKFSKIGLEQSDADEFARLRQELTAFIALWKTPPGHREVKFGACPPPIGSNLISKADVLTANFWLRSLLTNLEQNQPTSFTPKITCTVSRIQNAKGWALTHEITGPDLDVFKYETYTAFADTARGHQPCARCGRIFVPHGRSLYCSKTCGAITRTLRWRENKKRWRKDHPEETREAAHRHYKRRVQKAKSATLARKVARRPRRKSPLE